MKKILLLLIVLPISVIAQITWVPFFPQDTDSITVTFNATQGNAGLAGYTGDVYAHTGVITTASTSGSDWKYVKTGWGVNTPETRLTRIGTDLYEFKIKPSVRAFYGVPAGETILKVAFVFRNTTGSLTGKTADGGDIFLDLASGAINVSITSPSANPSIVLQNAQVNIQAISNGSTNLALYIDNTLITQTGTNSINYNYTAASAGKKWIKAVATSGGGSAADSIYIIVRPPVAVQDVPAGIKDGITYTSPTTATLSLYAPLKEFVYVVGDFTNWQVDPNLYMKKSTDGTRFWTQLAGLSPGTEYAFQYFIDGSMYVADPYAEKILDPWNDQYINSFRYPNLKPYPNGKATNIVSVLQTAQSAYQWVNTNFTRPAKEDLVIYETLIRDFTTEQTYQSIIDTLSYFKNLGINAIQLMPVMEFEGNNSWGYNPMFMFAADKYYGPKNKLKELVDKAHGMGIAVIFDIVLNHQFGLSPLVRMWWDAANNRPAANSPYFNIEARHPFNVGYDMNHESQATKDFVDRVTSFWINEYKADGFRFDLSKGFTQTNSGSNVGQWSQYDQSRINILTRMTNKIFEIDPNIYVILEHFGDNSEETVLANAGMMLWGNHNFNYNEATMGYHSGNNSNFSGISYKSRGWNSPHLVGYMESHDEERIMYKNITFGNSSGSYNIKNMAVALNRMKLANAFFLLVPGPKMIWQWGELGYEYSVFWPCGSDACKLDPKPPRWEFLQDAARVKLKKVFAALSGLKRNYPAFKSTDFTMSVSGAMKRINIYHNSMNVVIIGNFDVVTQSINPLFPAAGTWYNYFDASSMSVSDPNAQISLAPGEFRIYTSVQLPAPEPGLLTDIETISAELPEEYSLMQNYPNPFNPVTNIRFALKEAGEVKLTVYDVMGNEITTLVNEYRPAGVYEAEFDASRIASGVYFYGISAGNFREMRKLILLK